MAEIFALKPEDEKRLHPHALKRLKDWTEDLVREVPQLGQLEIDEINADVNTYLNDDEKARATKYTADVTAWLLKCMGIGNGYSPYPYSKWVFDSMYELKRLVKTAYERKQKKAEVERREKEDSERWRDAYIAIKPPIDDAKKYYNEEGYDEFIKAARGAIAVYLEKGEKYLDDTRASDYSWCLRELRDRKREEKQKITANLAAQKYNRQLNDEKARSLSE